MRFLWVALALIVCVGGAYEALRGRVDSPAGRIDAYIADVHFSFASAYARDEATAAGGFADRLAFVAIFPNFDPPTRVAKTLSPDGQLGLARDAVFLTVSAKDEILDPAERPMQLYARFLQAETISGPGGLVARRFEKGSPYDLEQLYVAPPDGKDFFARCPNVEGTAAPGDSCISMFRVDGLDVELRFAPELLENWDALNTGARGFISQIRAKGAEQRR